MKRSRFSDEQIIGILKEHAAGLTATELCRKHGISDATFYKWRSKYGGGGGPAAVYGADAVRACDQFGRPSALEDRRINQVSFR